MQGSKTDSLLSEYDFIVSPGADPNQIALTFSGADSVEIDANGDLVLQTGDTELRQQKPYIYQEVNGARQQVAGEFRIQNSEFKTEDSSLITHHSSLVTFDVGAYDPSRPLVIDPLVLGYSTYLGSSPQTDFGFDFAVDANGNAYVTGETHSPRFPTTAGAFDETYNAGTNDAFVAKLNADGSALEYATFLGGVNSDQGRGIEVDANGNAYIAGATWSRNFPATEGAFDTSFNSPANGETADAFVIKLSADGSNLVYSTFLGTLGSDIGAEIDIDAAGAAYVIGGTSSKAFPTTPNAFDTSYNGRDDTFIAKLDSTGSSLVYASFLGGSKSEGAGDLTVDLVGNVYIVGATESPDFPTTTGAFDGTYNGDYDGYVTKINPAGTALVYSTYLGGEDGEGCCGILVDSQGAAYVGGSTPSDDFPTTPGAYKTFLNIGPRDGFLTKFNTSGTGLVFSTFYGGGSSDGAVPAAFDESGNVYLVGGTGSSDFPTSPDAFDKTYNGGHDVLLLKFNATGSALLYASFFGGSNIDQSAGMVMDDNGDLYVAGTTQSGDFPTTPNALKRRNTPNTRDAFVTKFLQA